MFTDYWALGDLLRQREFILRCIDIIVPKYRYVREGSKRRNNQAFYFTIINNKIKASKQFFKSTLSILSDCPIRTMSIYSEYMNDGMTMTEAIR